MKKTSYILTMLLAVSCVYPFNPEIAREAEHRLVISGDILVGDVTRISLGYVAALDGSMKNDYPNGFVWIENDGGDQYMESGNSSSGNHYIDLTGAPADKQYKLHVALSGGNQYETPWMCVQEAPRITDFGYKTEGDQVLLLLSLEGGEVSTRFRWDYEEIWEFHADFVPEYMYVPKLPERQRENPKYIYREREAEEDYYYCWDSAQSTEYGLASTEGQSANKVIENNFLNLSCYSTKLQILYSILIKARGVSKECYGYLHNMNAISNNTGSLFSPTPSEVRGNITCVEDPDEFVYGYVEATRLSERRFFIDQNKAHLFKMSRNPELQLFFPAVDEDGLYNFETLYENSNAPVRLSDGPEPTRTNMLWAPTRCTDCRAAGGSKNKPDWWPNQDK